MLADKFRRSLARRFAPRQQQTILECCLDRERLFATPVHEFTDMLVA